MKIDWLLVLGGLLLAQPVCPAGKSQRDLTDLSLEELANVTVHAAARHPQSLADAPASVTVITADEIRRYGYRTLADALSYARGFFTTYDRTYHYPGVRGFALPGDNCTRMLVMINGHNTVFSVDNSATLFGQDFPLDMSLVKQIEIIRGPSSALYGSNGIFATINVVTRSPDDFESPEATADLGSFGEKKLQVASSVPVGHGASLLLSGSVFNNRGEHTLDLPELGQAVNMDGEKGYHLFADFVRNNWNITALFGARQKIQPVSWGPVIFNDRGTRANDIRNFVEASYTRDLRAGTTLRWRTYYDAAYYHGIYRYDMEGAVEDNREFDDGDWIGSELTCRLNTSRFGSLTLGAEGKIELRTLQHVLDVRPVPQDLLSINTPDKTFAIFGQQELDLGRKWKMNLGARLDLSRYRGNFASPRFALIYQPSPRVSYKFLYGRAFRVPSAYEMFFEDGLTGAANPSARPEKADTFELVAERKLTGRLNVLASVYHYRFKDLLVPVYTDAGLLQYRNSGEDRASGVEMEVNGRPARWLDVLASLAIQRTVDIAHYPLPNSPGQIGKLRFSVPLFARRLSLGVGTQFLGRRQTDAGATLPRVVLPEVVLTSHLTSNFDVQFGIRNVLHRNYADPVALNTAIDTIGAPGRAFFFTLTARPPD